MARYRKANIFRDNIRWILLGLVLSLVIIAAIWFLFGRDDEKNVSTTPVILGDVYICSGCGKQYKNMEKMGL